MRYLTAGESHGESLIGIIEGLPSGLKINIDFINEMLSRRRLVYGRGSRASVVPDSAQIKSGVCDGVTTGAPVAVVINNGSCGKVEFDFYRPGHVDFVSAQKYAYSTPSLGAERASARETAMRTALGAIALQMLSELNITVSAFVTQIGSVCASATPTKLNDDLMCDESAANAMKAEIDEAASCGETLGGKIKLVVSGLIAGIGSHVHYDRRLDYKLGGALMAIPSVKAVEVGYGTNFASAKGKSVADEFDKIDGKIVRKTNFCGGIEGGISNGENLEFTLTLKPIPSVADVKTLDVNYNSTLTTKVRGDVTAVPAACSVACAVIGLELAAAISDCFGGDTISELKSRYKQKGKSQCKKSL